MHASTDRLDGKYTAFGKVVSGIEVVDEIVKTGPTEREANGKVPPNSAVVLQKVEIKTWPLQ